MPGTFLIHFIGNDKNLYLERTLVHLATLCTLSSVLTRFHVDCTNAGGMGRVS